MEFGINCATILIGYDTSFLKRTHVVINGDVESNPGPIASAISHRVAIGRYYNRAVYLSGGHITNMNACCCQKYEKTIFKHCGCNMVTMVEIFNDEVRVVKDEYTPKDLEFCIATIELVYDVSFLKILQLIVDGDIESNPGPTPKGTPKGRKAKKT